MSARIRRDQLTPMQHAILRQLGERKKYSASELAERISAPLSEVMPTAAEMVAAELLHVRGSWPTTYGATRYGYRLVAGEHRGEIEQREHGTVKGYHQHRRVPEDACDECRKANTRDASPRIRARASALSRLRQAHPVEYLRLLNEEKTRFGL